MELDRDAKSRFFEDKLQLWHCCMAKNSQYPRILELHSLRDENKGEYPEYRRIYSLDLGVANKGTMNR